MNFITLEGTVYLDRPPVLYRDANIVAQTRFLKIARKLDRVEWRRLKISQIGPIEALKGAREISLASPITPLNLLESQRINPFLICLRVTCITSSSALLRATNQTRKMHAIIILFSHFAHNNLHWVEIQVQKSSTQVARVETMQFKLQYIPPHLQSDFQCPSEERMLLSVREARRDILSHCTYYI